METVYNVPHKILAQWKKQLKSNRGSINTVAANSGVSHSYISMMLSGNRDMTMKAVRAIKEELKRIKKDEQNFQQELKSA